MSSKDIITIDLIRKVNNRILDQDKQFEGKRSVYSSFLNKELVNSAPSDSISINAAWAKTRELLINA